MKQNVSKLSYLLLVVGLVMSVMTGCGSEKSKTLDCEQLIEVTFDGFEGYATPVFAFNSDVASDRDAMDKMFPDNTRKEAEEILAELFEELVITADKQGDLKNGDTVIITVDYEEAEDILEDYELELSNTSFEVEVEDLEEGTVLDPFEKLQVTFGGYEGNGDATINVNEVENIDILHRYGRYEVVYDSLSNGDVVTVTYVITETSEANLLEAGYAVSAKEKEYTVSGLEALKEVSPFDYLTVTFEGYNGDGEISAKKNSDYLDIFYYCDVTISQETGLTNGDVVTITYSVTSEESITRRGYKLTETVKEYTVEGLSDYTLINVFAPECIVINGLSPVIEVAVDLSGFDSGIRYNVDIEITGGIQYGDRMFFKDGETVTITAIPDVERLHSYGYELESTEFILNFEDYLSYAQPEDDFSAYQAACLETAKERINNLYLNDYNYDWGNKLLEFTGLKVVEEGLYVIVDKQLEHYGDYSKKYYNVYYTLYEVEGTWDRERDDTYYYMVAVSDVRYDETGAMIWDELSAKIDNQKDYIEARDLINLDYYKLMTTMVEEEEPTEEPSEEPSEEETEVVENEETTEESVESEEETTLAAEE